MNGQMSDNPVLQPRFFRRIARHPVLAGAVTEITAYCENGHALAGDVEMATLVVPLVISFGEPFRIALGRVPSECDRWASFAAGLYPGPVTIGSTGKAECIQVNFTPLGASRFFGVPMHALSKRMVRLEDLGDRSLARLRQRLGEERCWRRRLDLAEQFVIDRLARAPAGNIAVRSAFVEISSARGDIRISSLAKRLGWSRKHLVDRFRDEFGLSPKTLARMVRFRHALALAESTGSTGWADIAASCGYSDQSHMTREFAELAGRAPSTFNSVAGRD